MGRNRKVFDEGSRVWYFVATMDSDMVLRQGVVKLVDQTLRETKYKVETQDEPEDSPYRDFIYLTPDTIFASLDAARKGLIRYLTKEIAGYMTTKHFCEEHIKALKKIRTREKYWDNMARTAKRLQKEKNKCS